MPTDGPRRAAAAPAAKGGRRGGCGGPAVIISAVLVLAILAGVGYVGYRLYHWATVPTPSPPSEQCVVTSGETSYRLTPEQAMYASIITAESIRRGLPARAATIAIATALQESRLQNIDYGDRDSVGLFQQRPSQDWGTVEQIMDPWYSAGEFYAHLVKVKGWQTGDINDVAQKVQRSGVPEGYRKHVAAAKAWSSGLTGHSPGSITCLSRGGSPEYPYPKALDQIITKGLAGKVTATSSGKTMTLTADNGTLAWASAAMAMTTLQNRPIASISVGGRTWTHDTEALGRWSPATPATGADRVVITFG